MTGLSTLPGAWFPAVDLNPFHWAGDQVEQSLADGFTAMMMSLWSAGLWLIDMVFGVIDQFTTPNLADPGLGHLYSLTLWVSLVMALCSGWGRSRRPRSVATDALLGRWLWGWRSTARW